MTIHTRYTIHTDYSTPAASLGRCAHILIDIVKRSRSQLFLVDKVWRSHSSYGDDSLDQRWTPIKIRMEGGGLHASIEGIITVLLR